MFVVYYNMFILALRTDAAKRTVYMEDPHTSEKKWEPSHPK
jgi:hypothetical protein